MRGVAISNHSDLKFLFNRLIRRQLAAAHHNLDGYQAVQSALHPPQLPPEVPVRAPGHRDCSGSLTSRSMCGALSGTCGHYSAVSS